jgi:hypothetical protein
MRPARAAGRTYALGSCPVTRSRAGYAVGKPEEAGRCQTRPVRSEAMPLYALDDSGQPVRVLEGGPRRASCAECGAPMRWDRLCPHLALGAPGAQPALQGGPGNRMAPGLEGAGVAGRSRSAASSLSTASAVDRPVNMDGITVCGMGSQERTQLRRSGRVATPQRSPAEARRSGCSVLQHRPDLAPLCVKRAVVPAFSVLASPCRGPAGSGSGASSPENEVGWWRKVVAGGSGK